MSFPSPPVHKLTLMPHSGALSNAQSPSPTNSFQSFPSPPSTPSTPLSTYRATYTYVPDLLPAYPNPPYTKYPPLSCSHPAPHISSGPPDHLTQPLAPAKSV